MKDRFLCFVFGLAALVLVAQGRINRRLLFFFFRGGWGGGGGGGGWFELLRRRRLSFLRQRLLV